MKERQNLDQDFLNTCFDRQVRIQHWDQKKLQGQTALILGVGGLGSVVLISLLRLGIHKIYFVDYDQVDTHNLNRQLIYTLKDVGKSKVQSVIKNSEFHNIADTKLEGFNGNALTNWQKIVAMAKDSQIVFNCIDYGEYFDMAVASLCLTLQIPLIMGGTFATSFTIDYFSPQGKACFLCSAGGDAQIIKKVNLDKILTLQDISFLPKNNNPIGRSSVVVCTVCGELMVSHYLNYLFLAETDNYPSTRLIAYHNSFEIFKFDIEKQNKCLFCGDPNYVDPPKQQQQLTNKIQHNNQQKKERNQQPLKKQQIVQEKIAEQHINKQDSQNNKKTTPNNIQEESPQQ